MCSVFMSISQDGIKDLRSNSYQLLILGTLSAITQNCSQPCVLRTYPLVYDIRELMLFPNF